MATALSDGYEPFALPLAPSVGTPTSGNTTVTAAWTALTPTTARPVDGYRVYVYSNSSATTLVEGITNPVSVTGSATTSTSVTGLTNGTRYWLKVAGYNEAGEGAKSSVSAEIGRAHV